MNEKIRKKIIFAALFIAIIWGLFNYEWPTRPEEADVAPAALPSVAGMTRQKSLTPEVVEEKTNRNWGDDPFRIKNGKQISKQGGNWVVSGILYNTATPLAYINRTPLQIGDTIDNARVVNIEPNYVVLNYNGSDHKIYFSEG
ncbi:MAG: hypothetical protein JXA92_14240 [candidate division Zixibacteria bacterium]|nr:hypothetical protein [candidate division Zixibacteria bacterium]